MASSRTVKLRAVNGHIRLELASIERQPPGITILGSAHGSVRGDAGICHVLDRFMEPVPAEGCAHFAARMGASLRSPGRLPRCACGAGPADVSTSYSPRRVLRSIMNTEARFLASSMRKNTRPLSTRT